MSIRPFAQFRPVELALASMVALPIPFIGGYALSLSSAANAMELPAIDRGAAVPIRVKPVLDLESPNVKLGGGKAKVKMPKAWADPPKPSPARETQVSTKATDDPAAIPSPEVPLATATATAPPAEAPTATSSAEPASEPLASAEAASTEEPPGAGAEGAVDSTSDPGAPPGPGAPDGDPNGDPDADPRKRNAARRYLGRVVSWFLSRFRAQCATIPPEERSKFRAVASVVIGADGTVVSYSLSRSGNEEIDGAAERAMQSAQGQQIPPPPEDFPELRPNSTSVTFVCGS